MALTDSESFGQVSSPVVDESLLFEKEVETYDEAIQAINKRLDGWVKEEAGDVDFASYVKELKDHIEQNKEDIIYSATMQDASASELSLTEYKAENSAEAIFINIQTRLKNWFNSLEEGLLKSTIKSVQSYMHENKNTLSSISSNIDSAILPSPTKTYSLDESTTEQPYTNGTSNTSPTVTHDVGSTNDGKTLGSPTTDKSTAPLENPSIKTESPTGSEKGKNLYRNGEKKEFVWYKDNHSKAPTEVAREQGVQSSGITEFTPSKEKMDIDNPVDKEQGVQSSGITEFTPSKEKMDIDNPVDREQGVEASNIREYIKVEENSKYQSNLRVYLRAIKESFEI
jgi:hypothetical protein